MPGFAQPEDRSVEEPFTVLAQLREQGLIGELGVSNVTADMLAEAQKIAPVVCVQNLYNIANRGDESLVRTCAEQGIAYVPFFPLGGFTPLQSDTLSGVARRLGFTPMQVALAWLLARAPNILLIPGTSSLAHFRENLAAATIRLDGDALAELATIGAHA